MLPIDTSDGRFHDGNGSTIQGTRVTAVFQNSVQDEIINVIVAAGLVPSEDVDQLKKAIAALSISGMTSHLAEANPHSQYLLTEDAQKILNALDNFIGMPLAYPLGVVPAGWVAMQGQNFDPVAYPKLAQLYATNTLPDLRGEFIRGWDNGRGIDVGRELLSAQLDALQTHDHTLNAAYGDGGGSTYCMRTGGATAGTWGRVLSTITARVAAETRSRNISFNYICLAG